MTHTHKNGLWTLVWKEAHPTRSAARVRERQIESVDKSRHWRCVRGGEQAAQGDGGAVIKLTGVA